MKTKKTYGIYYSLLFTIAICCYVEQISAQEVAKSNPNKPDIRTKVNKEFDDKGNLIRFDSTYSYSWSGNGQIPINADSIFKQFNGQFSIGGDIDSAFNQFGFGWPFENSPFFDQPFAHSNKLFDKFFKRNQSPNDSLLNSSPNDFFSRDYREMIRHQQQMMDQFLKQLYQNGNPILTPPIDSIQLRKQPKENFKPDKQNYRQRKQSDKIISV